MSEYDRFGPYQIYECLGAGGMASVHHAALEVDGVRRDVALKRLLPQLADDQMFVEGFIREAKLAAQLVHPNIARMLELGRIGRTYYIAMELIRGHSLASILKTARIANQQAPIGCVVSVMIELRNVLDYVSNCTDDTGERLRVVHRDLTPGNLLIADDGHLKVIDFGVAKALSGRFMTNTGMIKGKLGYMSVEALGGKDLDARTDIFSAGVVMWEMLAGKRLFNGKDELTVIQQVRTARIMPPSEFNMNCPIELDEIVIKALERYREQRWETAGAMRLALDEVRRYYGDHASPLGVSRWKRKLRRDSSVRFARAHEDAADTNRLPTSDYEEFDVLEDFESFESMESLDSRDFPVEEPAPIDPHHDFHEVTEDEIGIKIFFADADNTEREK